MASVIAGMVIVMLSAGSLLNLSRSPHWFVRGWDFPRVQVLVMTLGALLVYIGARGLPLYPAAFEQWRPWDWGLTASAILTSVWHASHIWAYTPLARRQVVDARNWVDSQAIRIVVSNVEMENDATSHWSRVILEARPDVLIAVEVDTNWMERISHLRRQFKYEVAYPQSNWYGMVVLSNLPLSDGAVRFLVQDDVPSVHAFVDLPSGQKVRLVAVHPRPPEPIRDVDARHRNAELVLIAKELDGGMPAIVGGDLNDVAWSSTTRLFLRLSKLLDPRRGRGFFNTFHAKHRWFRFPLDHIFHSRHFTLRRIERLRQVGSDHFPMLIELQFEPDKISEQPAMEKGENDEDFAEEILKEEVEGEEQRESPEGVAAGG